jgi:16S rRNA G966 N2-methylase RsmD
MTKDFFDWIEAHKSDNPADLRLKYAAKKSPEGIDIPLAILQIECRRKCARKLRTTLARFPEFIFPTALSAEQCSSDALAEFHATLIPPNAETGADLTAGLGIDALALARQGLRMTAVDKAPELTRALGINADTLPDGRLSAVNADCRQWLRTEAEQNRKFDVIFIDPARRASDGKRLFALSDCAPDVVEIMPLLARTCRRLIIKASPMLDITHTIGELTPPGPSRIIAAGTNSECKELIAIVDFPAPDSPVIIEAATILSAEKCVRFSYTPDDEHSAPPVNPGPGLAPPMYLLEPYPATMKCGAHRCLASRFGVYGFDPNTRLYYSPELPVEFPGECFETIDVQEYTSHNIKRFARTYPAISVTTRNFGIGADELRRKLRVREADGSLRLFALTDAQGRKLLALCKRITSEYNANANKS